MAQGWAQGLSWGQQAWDVGACMVGAPGQLHTDSTTHTQPGWQMSRRTSWPRMVIDSGSDWGPLTEWGNLEHLFSFCRPPSLYSLWVSRVTFEELFPRKAGGTRESTEGEKMGVVPVLSLPAGWSIWFQAIVGCPKNPLLPLASGPIHQVWMGKKTKVKPDFFPKLSENVDHMHWL